MLNNYKILASKVCELFNSKMAANLGQCSDIEETAVIPISQYSKFMHPATP